jgi:hypothetical protein
MSTVILPKRSETALAIPSAGSLAVGELAMNITDGKFYTKTTGGSVKRNWWCRCRNITRCYHFRCNDK